MAISIVTVQGADTPAIWREVRDQAVHRKSHASPPRGTPRRSDLTDREVCDAAEGCFLLMFTRQSMVFVLVHHPISTRYTHCDWVPIKV